ncbi:MAG TPA: GNAT family N-acetyltransferase [Verrucomicrobiae bacterium]|nr:GNAT family N-acetyltransferase [Verrucomicrobiae bacterium]
MADQNGNHYIRPYQPDDAASMHRVAVRAALNDGVDSLSTLESIPSLEDLVNSLEANNSDTDADVFVAVDGETNEVVGYGKVSWWDEEDGTFLYLHQGRVDPAHRRQGVGGSLLETLQDRIKEIVAEHPIDAPKMLGANASESEKDTLALIDKNGYQKVWSSLEMEFTDFSKIDGITLPEGYELRPVESEEDKHKVYKANKEIYEGTWGNTPDSDEDYQDFLAQSPDSSLWRVAWHGNEVAGFVLSRVEARQSAAGSDTQVAEVTQVGVLPVFRRKGLAGALMAESLRSLHVRGMEIVRLHTDADGKMGGRQLYDNLGFSALKEHHRFRKPLEDDSNLTTGS